MIDFVRISVKAGDGGDGAGSFTHIKGKRQGKADGGDGGCGGDVYIEASADLNTLEPFRFVKEYRAKNGGNGASRRRKGAEGEDLVIKVPVGTQIKVTNVTEEPMEPNEISREHLARLAPLKPLLLFDLVDAGQKVLVACGGEGGRGNSHLKDEFGRRPKSAENGQDGEVVNLELELKLIADVGLIGLPNAGKSTLLAKLTQARPKIADYPFTTLEPNLGVMKIGVRGQRLGSSDNKKKSNYTLYPNHYSLTIADIPGLIEGASRGKGLGDLFLRHIERTKVLVHLIDISTSADVWCNYQTIRAELKDYSKELTAKKEIIALNKIDLVTHKEVDQASNFFKLKRKRVVAISAQNGLGLDQLVQQVLKTW